MQQFEALLWIRRAAVRVFTGLESDIVQLRALPFSLFHLFIA